MERGKRNNNNKMRNERRDNREEGTEKRKERREKKDEGRERAEGTKKAIIASSWIDVWWAQEYYSKGQ